MHIQQAINLPLRTLQFSLAILWIYQGLVPKILFQAQDEQRIWQMQGVNETVALTLMQWSGWLEIIFGCLFLMLRPSQLLHYLNIVGMIALSLLIVAIDPRYFSQAFNPFIMNVAMATLSIIAIQLLRLSKNTYE